MQNFTLRYLFKVQLIGIHEPKTLNYRNNYIKTQNKLLTNICLKNMKFSFLRRNTNTEKFKLSLVHCNQTSQYNQKFETELNFASYSLFQHPRKKFKFYIFL